MCTTTCRWLLCWDVQRIAVVCVQVVPALTCQASLHQELLAVEVSATPCGPGRLPACDLYAAI
jgi:hypothetical protein